MSNVNKVILVGRLGTDPEAKELGAGNAVCNFSVATTESWKDKQGSKQEKTEWHRVCAFGKLAEICGKYLSKGSLVYLEGQLQTTSYEKDGVKQYSTQIRASQLQMLGGKEKKDDEIQF